MRQTTVNRQQWLAVAASFVREFMMTSWLANPLKTLSDVERFEAEMPLDERLPGNSVYEVLLRAAEEFGDRTALTMLMTGDAEEDPRRVNYTELLALVRQTANMFSGLGGERPGVAFMLPTLIETHAVLWAAETVGYAVPINFLLQPDHIRGLLEASTQEFLSPSAHILSSTSGRNHSS